MSSNQTLRSISHFHLALGDDHHVPLRTERLRRCPSRTVPKNELVLLFHIFIYLSLLGVLLFIDAFAKQPRENDEPTAYHLYFIVWFFLFSIRSRCVMPRRWGVPSRRSRDGSVREKAYFLFDCFYHPFWWTATHGDEIWKMSKANEMALMGMSLNRQRERRSVEVVWLCFPRSVSFHSYFDIDKLIKKKQMALTDRKNEVPKGF